MGLTFTVGNASDVFFGEFADQVEHELARQLNYSAPRSTALDLEAYRSEEVAWFGWAQLQQKAVSTIGKDRVPQLLFIEAWRGVYLPLGIEPVQLIIDEEDDQAWLQCGSLSKLLRELDQLALIGNLPTDPVGLNELWERFFEEGADPDEDMDIQTYVQLMLAVQVAIERGMPLWVVK